MTDTPRSVLPSVYARASDMWIVACYYNPEHFASRLRNFTEFVAPLIKGECNLLVIECALHGHEFELPLSLPLLRVRARSPLWRKESLLNRAISELPERCTKVAWVDCDVVFSNARWIVEASSALDHVKLLQPWSHTIALTKFGLQELSKARITEGFVSRTKRGDRFSSDMTLLLHGHTGLAWCARRELLSHVPLYDRDLSGSADHMMAHAAYGDWEGRCVQERLRSQAQHSHFMNWARIFHQNVGTQIDYLEGNLYHFWHGSLDRRRYRERAEELAQFGFDPIADTVDEPGGSLELAENRPELTAWSTRYFSSRQEDE